MKDKNPILIKYSTGYIFQPKPWCSRKHHWNKIKKIIGDGRSIKRDGSIDDYHLQNYIETYNEGFYKNIKDIVRSMLTYI